MSRQSASIGSLDGQVIELCVHFGSGRGHVRLAGRVRNVGYASTWVGECCLKRDQLVWNDPDGEDNNHYAYLETVNSERCEG